MRLYIAKIIYRIICGDGAHTPQFEEQLIFIEAEHRQAALEKCTSFSAEAEESFPSDYGENVEWKFIGISELNEIRSIKDGAEIYSALYETEDAESYISRIKYKEQTLQDNYNLIAIQ